MANKTTEVEAKPSRTVFISPYKMFAWESTPGHIIQFNSNGKNGIFITDDEAEKKALRGAKFFGTDVKEVLEDEVPAGGRKVVVGVRSALGALPVPDEMDEKTKQILKETSKNQRTQ